MAERFLVSVDLKTLDSSREGGLNFKTTSYLNRVYTSVTPETVDEGNLFLQNHFHECVTYLDVTAIEKLDDIISLLDSGAAKVFVTYKQLKDIVEEHRLSDLGRLIVSIDHSSCEEDPEESVEKINKRLRDIVGCTPVGVYIHDVHEWELLDTVEKHGKKSGFPTRYVTLSSNTRDNYIRAVKGGHIPIVPATALTVDPARYPGLISPVDLITATITSDRPDRLYPTVVTDERGVCLGLVYSNAESIHESLRIGRGVYKSRRREGLWIKGETSGDWQDLISVSWDCDGDCLRFMVRQKGDGKDQGPSMRTALTLCRILSSKTGNMLWQLQRFIKT